MAEPVPLSVVLDEWFAEADRRAGLVQPVLFELEAVTS